ncbi:MAG: N-acetyltransferase [Bacteroidetes bacterium]|nr:N-acetyltransferase [Bacteroidota bacterium]
MSDDNIYQSISDDVQLGENVQIHKFVNLYGCSIGDNTKIGTFVEVQKNASIGKNCKISSHSFICEGTNIEDEVFVGHGVKFINDKYPRAVNKDGSMKEDADWNLQTTKVKKRASIGSGSVVLGNITIGENAIVGAGSVVTKDVEANTIVAGNPAKLIRTVNSE